MSLLGPVARHRHPDRRRHRGAREHRAPHRDGQGPLHGGARGHRRDRPRGGGDDLLHRRGVRAGRLHVRGGGAVVQAVRAHHRLRGAGVALRVLLARPDALGLLGGPADRGARAAESDRPDARPLQPLVRPAWRTATKASSPGRSTTGWRWCCSPRGTFVGAIAMQARARGRGLRAGERPQRDQHDPRDAAGSNLEYTRIKAEEAARVARAHPEVAYTYTTVGTPSAQGAVGGPGTHLRAAGAQGTSARSARRRWARSCATR